MKKIWLVVATLSLSSAFAQAPLSRAVLLDVAVQMVSPTRNFVYNTSPLIPIGESSKIPIRSSAVNAGEMELQIKSEIPKNATGKNIIEVQIELLQNQVDGSSKVLGRGKVLTRLHESVALGQTETDGSKILFTLTPLEIQSP